MRIVKKIYWQPVFVPWVLSKSTVEVTGTELSWLTTLKLVTSSSRVSQVDVSIAYSMSSGQDFWPDFHSC
jgi:hypothetical protein